MYRDRNILRGKVRSRDLSFTLIELLMVVAIISILSAIALPNFLEAQTRAKVARAKNDLRAIATALEAYHADNCAYPQAALIPPPRRLRPLTMPIAYITTLPEDPFNLRRRWRFYRYGAMPLDVASRWILASVGPDLHSSTNPIEFYPGYQPGLFCGQVEGFDYILYDPTNGTVSWGDVVRASDFIPE